MKRFSGIIAFVTMATFLQKAIAAPGDLYEADFGSGSVFKFTRTGVETTFASGMVNPSGVAFDSHGNLFVADFGTGQILKFAPNGTQSIFKLGLNKPFGLAIDAADNVFEADLGSGNIFKFAPDASQSLFASGLQNPAGLAFDHSGNLFVSDFKSGDIFEFPAGGGRNTLASGLHSPDGVTIDGNGSIVEGDSGSGTVLRFSSAGARSTAAAGFNQPTGVGYNIYGDLFVSDNAAGTITRLGTDGTRTTFASGLLNPQYLAFEPALGPALSLGNISTRGLVQTGDQVLIGGFIINGTAPKQVLIRAIGPSLSNFQVAGPLQDPVLSLHNTMGEIANNDDWQSAANSGQIPMALQPSDPRESAILISLVPGQYTAIVTGKGGTTGVGLVEVYDLEPASDSALANISTRGFVGTGDNVMIGGFVVGGANKGTGRLLIRAIGPSLAGMGVNGPLSDPVLALFDANGQKIATNDNWKDNEELAIAATMQPPGSDLESAIVTTLLSQGSYTAIVSGKNGGTGVALVEVFRLQ